MRVELPLHLPVPESLSKIKTSLPMLHGRSRWGLRLAAACVVAGASLLTACDPAPTPQTGGQFETSYVNPIREATAEAAATAASSPEPSAIPASPTPQESPTVIPTKEAPEAFDCMILSPEACALLRPSYRINSDGSKQLLGFVANLPVGERIFPDITGEFAKTEDSNGKPIGILSNEEGSKRKSTIIRGKIEFTGRKTVDGRHINETITIPGAAPIAFVVAPPDDPDGFNFSIELSETERSTAKTIADMERVGRYFPDLGTRTPYLAPGSTTSNRGVIVIDKFQ